MASIKLRTITCLKCDMPENLDAAEYFEHYGQFHLDLQVFKCGGCKRSFSTYFFAALHRCKGEKKVELIADENEKETQCKLLALQKGLNDSLKTQFEQATQYFKNYVSEQLVARMEEDNKEMEAAAQLNEAQPEDKMEECEREPEREAEKKPETEPEVEASEEPEPGPEPEAEVEPEKQGGLEEGEIPDTDDEQKPEEPPAAQAASTSYHSMIDSDDEMEEQDSVGEEDDEEEDEHLTDFVYGGRPEEFSRRRSSCEEPEEKRPRLQEPVADSEAVENIDTAKIKQILDKPEVLEMLKTLDPTKLNVQKEPEIDASKAKELLKITGVQEMLNNLEAAKLLKLQKEKELEEQNNAAAAQVKERHDSLDSTNFDDLEEVDEVGEDDVQIHLGDDNEEGTLYIPATPSEKADITVTIDDDYRLNGRISFPGRAAGKN